MLFVGLASSMFVLACIIYIPRLYMWRRFGFGMLLFSGASACRDELSKWVESGTPLQSCSYSGFTAKLVFDCPYLLALVREVKQEYNRCFLSARTLLESVVSSLLLYRTPAICHPLLNDMHLDAYFTV